MNKTNQKEREKTYKGTWAILYPSQILPKSPYASRPWGSQWGQPKVRTAWGGGDSGSWHQLIWYGRSVSLQLRVLDPWQAGRLDCLRESVDLLTTKVEMQEQICARSLCMYLVGELLIMCKVCFGGADVGIFEVAPSSILWHWLAKGSACLQAEKIVVGEWEAVQHHVWSNRSAHVRYLLHSYSVKAAISHTMA